MSEFLSYSSSSKVVIARLVMFLSYNSSCGNSKQCFPLRLRVEKKLGFTTSLASTTFPLLLHLLKHHWDEQRSFQRVMLSAAGYSISPDMAFILESLIELLKLPWQGQNLTCLSPLQLLLCSQTGSAKHFVTVKSCCKEGQHICFKNNTSHTKVRSR